MGQQYKYISYLGEPELAYILSALLQKQCWALKQLKNLKGNSCSESPPEERDKEIKGKVSRNEDGGVGAVLKGAVIVFFFLSQTVSSYVYLPSLLIFIPKMQE